MSTNFTRAVITSVLCLLAGYTLAQKNNSRKIDKMNNGLVGVWQFQKATSNSRVSDSPSEERRLFVEFLENGSFRYMKEIDKTIQILDSGYWYMDYSLNELKMEILMAPDTIFRTDYPFAFDNFYDDFIADMKKESEVQNGTGTRSDWDPGACNNDTLVRLNMDVQLFKVIDLNPKQLVLQTIYYTWITDINPPDNIYYYKRIVNP